MTKGIVWVFWFILVASLSIIFSTIYINDIVEDNTYISIIIVSIFYFSLLYSLRIFFYIMGNIYTLENAPSPIFKPSQKDFIYNGNYGLFERHIDNLVFIYRNNPYHTINQEPILQSLKNSIFRKIAFLPMVSNMLITFGLIGTIVGLTISLGGLNETIQNEINQKTVEGIKMAINGMGTSFYTTLFGAVFGGVFLKIIHFNTVMLADELIDSITLETEIHVIPFLNDRK